MALIFDDHNNAIKCKNCGCPILFKQKSYIFNQDKKYDDVINELPLDTYLVCSNCGNLVKKIEHDKFTFIYSTKGGL